MTTTWNPADKSANITLTSANLGAFASANVGGDNLVRATSFKTTGKFYFEDKTGASEEDGIGLANSSENLSNYIGQTNNSCGIYQSGNFYLGGSHVQTGPAITVVGQILGVAVDFGGALIWFRNQTLAGNWNGGGTVNPATGVGGWSISALGSSLTICADVSQDNSHPNLLNVGASSFVGTIPAGFTAWDAGAPSFDASKGMFLLARG